MRALKKTACRLYRNNFRDSRREAGAESNVRSKHHSTFILPLVKCVSARPLDHRQPALRKLLSFRSLRYARGPTPREPAAAGRFLLNKQKADPSPAPTLEALERSAHARSG